MTELPAWLDAAELRVRGTDLNVTADALSAETLGQATSLLESTAGLTVTLELEISPVARVRDRVGALRKKPKTVIDFTAEGVKGTQS